MISRRNGLWLVPLILLLSFPLWKIPVADFLAPPLTPDRTTTALKSNRQNFSMSGITILQSEKGRKTATIRAAHATTSIQPNEYILKNVNGDIFDEDGKPTNVIANTGIYNITTKLLRLKNNVVITNKADNTTMKTNLLRYNGKRRIVVCPGKTRMIGDGITIDGSSFHHNMNTGVYTVGGRVYCTLKGY